MRLVAPFVTTLFALLFCGFNSSEGAAVLPEETFSLFLQGTFISLPFYLFPIIIASVTHWGNDFRNWLRWGVEIRLRALLPTFLLFLLVVEATMAILPQLGVQDSVELLSSVTPAQRLLLALPLCLVVPFFEEFLFRGILLHAGPAAVTLPLSALLFALAHGANLFALPLFIFGWVLGLLTLHTRSLLPAILFHALFNAITLLCS